MCLHPGNTGEQLTAIPLEQAVFNDYDYRLLSSDAPVTIAGMKSFDRHDKVCMSFAEPSTAGRRKSSAAE